MAKKIVERLPWSPGGKRLARALAACSFLPGSWDKRFARDMAEIADADDREPGKYGITIKQKENLIRLAHKYRRQIPNWGQMIFEPAGSPDQTTAQRLQAEMQRLTAEFRGMQDTPSTRERLKQAAEEAARNMLGAPKWVTLTVTITGDQGTANIHIEGTTT